MAKKSLGRGLGAILGEVAEAYEKEVPQDQSIVEIDIEAIRTNPYQPRKVFDEASLKELAESIKTHGLLQPIVVIEDIDGFMLIAGERRLRASKLAGLDRIKAIVASIDKSRYREYALIENIQREDLKPLDLAQSYKELIEEYGITHEELASILKKSRASITNTLRLLMLSDYAKEALNAGKITPGHAKVLVGLPEDEQRVVVDSIIGQRLSVRETERLVKKPRKNVTIGDSPKKSGYDLQKLAQRFKSLGIPCKIAQNRVILQFEDQEQIDKLIKILS
ncbi:MAG: chromosome partitioning protein ParB [Epsilonproteobacteria bacterium]|nr:chromosome partitioning protein ParB [Campylobacterota bacterium]NPA64550.1 ParB/RepB/Spo0J family partition protein [Campylobacterota bacterium]